VRPHHFYRQAHQRIFEVIEDLFSRGEPVDPITVSEQLANRASLETIGGREFIHSLVTAVPAATNAPVLRRDRPGETTSCGRSSRSAERSPRWAIAERSPRSSSSTGRSRWSSTSPRPEFPASSSFGRAHSPRAFRVGAGYVRRAPDCRVPDGLPRSGRAHRRASALNLIILAARPSMGKTAFALNVARNVAVEQKKGVAIFSLEMSKMEIVNRLMCSEARVDMWKIRRRELRQPRDWSQLAAACTPLHTAPIFIDDSASVKSDGDTGQGPAAQGSAEAPEPHHRRLPAAHDGDTNAENRQQEVSRISRGLKILARELDVPVLALSQLSRQVEQRAATGPCSPTFANRALWNRTPTRDVHLPGRSLQPR